MADGLYDDDELGRIGRPQPDAFPPVNLRGIQSSSLNPKPMSEATPIGGSSTMPPGIPPGVMPTPKPVSPLTTRRGADEKELERLNTAGSGISQIGKAHPIAGGILRGLDTLGSIAVPGLMSRIPGTEIHHEALVNKAKGNVATDIAEQGKDATTEETQAKVPLTEAQTREANANAADKEHPQPKPKEEEWTVSPEFVGPNGEPVQVEKNSGQMRIVGSDQVPGVKLKPQKEEKKDDFEKFYSDYLTDNNLPDSAHNRLQARSKFAAAGQAPQRDPKQLAVVNGQVIELTPGMKIPEGATTVKGDKFGQKEPTADEKRRADLAENLNENLNQLEDILKRRPDLFGPAAGRLTQLKGAVGTGDADVAALKVIMEQMGMAMVGAHAMRNAQHVETAANSIVNSLHNQPEAVAGAIKAARTSLKTFQNDMEHGSGGGTNGSAGSSEPVYATNPKTKERVMSTDGGKTWNPAK